MEQLLKFEDRWRWFSWLQLRLKRSDSHHHIILVKYLGPSAEHRAGAELNQPFQLRRRRRRKVLVLFSTNRCFPQWCPHNFCNPRSQHYQTLEKVLVTLEEHPAWKAAQHCGMSGQSSDEGGVQDGMMYIFQTLQSDIQPPGLWFLIYREERVHPPGQMMPSSSLRVLLHSHEVGWPLETLLTTADNVGLNDRHKPDI